PDRRPAGPGLRSAPANHRYPRTRCHRWVVARPCPAIPTRTDEECTVAHPLEFWLYLPQMRLTMDQLVERAQAAEAAGFAGVAGMDHLTPPLAENQPMYEGMITNTWLASRTTSLSVASLVLCDSFRHPAVLAREAVTLEHAS